MSIDDAKPSGAMDYAIGGCSREISVVGSIVRTALRDLQLPQEVYKVRLSEPPDLAKMVRSLHRRKLAAISLSGPLCHEALRLADDADEGATRSGCADMLMVTPSGVLASNTMYGTFVEWLESAVSNRSTAVVVGSGARACAVVAACQTLGFQVIGVTSRSWTSTEVLHESESAERIRGLGALPTLWPAHAGSVASTAFSREMRLQFRELAASANVLIQTVAIDPSTEDALLLARTVPWSQTPRDAVVCDLVYGPAPGPYLVEAERQGLARVGGVEMLTRRGTRLIETWTGRRPPRASLHAAAVRVCMRSYG